MTTRVYAYGALHPTAGGEQLQDQIRKAISYRRRLIDIEKKRWYRLAECEAEHCAEVTVAAEAVAELDRELEHRLRPTTKEERTAMRELRARRKETARVLRELRAAVRASHTKADEELTRLMEAWLLKHGRTDPPGRGIARREAIAAMVDDDRWPPYWRERLRIEAEYSHEVRAARASSGLYHGTYAAVEDAVESAVQAKRKHGSPPNHSWVESVRVGTQCQGGITMNRLEILPLPPAPPVEGRYKRRKRSRTVARVRIGSQEDGYPVWCELPIVLHRPLPPDARVLWAYVVQRRTGHRVRYELQVTVQFEGERAPAVRHEAVAVSIGWLRAENGGVLAATWLGSDGATGEVVVPESVERRMDHSAALLGVADKHFEAARGVYCSIRATLSAEEQERGQHAAHWRSHDKLRFAILRAIGVIGKCDIGNSYLENWKEWRIHRLSSKLDLMPTLEEARAWKPAGFEHWFLYCWTRKDQHLTQWARDVGRHALLHRREVFRVTAAQLAGRYQVVVLEGGGTKSGLADLRPHARHSDTPRIDATKGIRAQEHEDRSRRVRVAPGELRLALTHAFGTEVSPVPGPGDTTASVASSVELLARWRERSAAADDAGTARKAGSQCSDAAE